MSFGGLLIKIKIGILVHPYGQYQTMSVQKSISTCTLMSTDIMVLNVYCL